ncbi:hypothetical protein JOD29_003090 [Lysinibacillus composti]|nr:hypothetical protein [Lysinibacillus composti]
MIINRWNNDSSNWAVFSFLKQPSQPSHPSINLYLVNLLHHPFAEVFSLLSLSQSIESCHFYILYMKLCYFPHNQFDLYMLEYPIVLHFPQLPLFTYWTTDCFFLFRCQRKGGPIFEKKQAPFLQEWRPMVEGHCLIIFKISNSSIRRRHIRI